MDSMRVACLLAFAGLMAVGCGGDPEFTFPARDQTCATPGMVPCQTTEATPEDQRTFPVPETFVDPVTRTYLVSMISIPAPAGGRAPGFNVDGIDSGEGSSELDATCEELQTDYASTTDANHVGVDNALATLVPTIGSLVADSCPGGQTEGCIDNLLAEQLQEGALLLLMEVSGINDFSYDQDVQLSLYLGAVPAGAEIMVGADGSLAAGQTLDTEMALGTPVTGDILNGRLRANAATLPLNIDAGDFALTLTIANPEIRFDISETAGLANGAIGGVITVQSIIDLAAEIMPGIEETVRSVIESVADVGPMAGMTDVCESLSVGIAFSAVDTTRNP